MLRRTVPEAAPASASLSLPASPPAAGCSGARGPLGRQGQAREPVLAERELD